MGDAEIDEEEGGLPAAEGGGGTSPIIKWLLYVAGAIFGIIIVAIIAMVVAKQTATSTFKQMKNVALVKPPPPLANYNFTEEFRINTSDKGEAHFVKMKLAFGIAKEDQTLSAELAERNAQMRDLINLIVGRKSKDELINIEDQLDLREEIKAQVNHILTEGKIQEVYFTEFIVN
ncbi:MULTISPECIES: flagellar basal body-associated FliL family protein [Leptospira]|jgi:flagellar protein FliL|uniref:Flagellar protein FliL n=10 Tax=Leptospira TaxID=171 RepID=A0A2M9XQ05_9LEPT|nr:MULTISPECIES: flagellar basal body-associated FliL family protein [Leptospira]AOP35280.1 endoflagellar basal body-associated protein [Leptospira tipperaryensis]AYV55477.1 endoflagellar basal body-associated protein [Leptospira kmetyi]EQA54915.1 flagellar basal body-associated protein FliL [Leptospira kmetyi serovar Malaysia str. Bejo-Iso9]MBM9501133.1 flagellar basal body-associated FliL family protein [Leptospira ainazelensis]MBM9579235.1 flagellar basal body-associated FliL family protein